MGWSFRCGLLVQTCDHQSYGIKTLCWLDLFHKDIFTIYFYILLHSRLLILAVFKSFRNGICLDSATSRCYNWRSIEHFVLIKNLIVFLGVCSFSWYKLSRMASCLNCSLYIQYFAAFVAFFLVVLLLKWLSFSPSMCICIKWMLLKPIKHDFFFLVNNKNYIIKIMIDVIFF